MNFSNQVLASFLGSSFGFVFALILYFLTLKVNRHLNKKALLKNLKREFEYNLLSVDQWIGEVERIIHGITVNSPSIYGYVKYSDYLRLFIGDTFRTGLLYEIYTNEEIAIINQILSHLNLGAEQWVNNAFHKWRNSQNPQTDAAAALGIFEFEKTRLLEHKKSLASLIKKI